MKTDKQKLISLFKELGIGFEKKGNSLICREGNDKVGGYKLFFTVFEFNRKGQFIKMSILE